MIREFTFRGKTLEELKQLDTREFAKYLKSRARRTVLRQFDKIENFIGIFISPVWICCVT